MSNIDWKRCAACLENFDEAARKRWWVDCNHVYCTDCITSLFRPSLAGGPFPPQCCGQVISCWTHEELKAVLPEDLNSQLAKKKEEFDTSDRTYCSVPTCSTFVGAPHISGNDAKCPACECVTCVACKAPTHDGECPTDETLEEVLHIAETAGGKRCEKCGSMIERMEGCDEMVCICGHTFCFGCGAAYGHCDCESDNDGEEPDYYRCSECNTAAVCGNSCNCADGVPKPDHRDRGHQGWALVRGGGVCVHCGEDMSEFLMECQDCRIRSCRRCMQNKL